MFERLVYVVYTYGAGYAHEVQRGAERRCLCIMPAAEEDGLAMDIRIVNGRWVGPTAVLDFVNNTLGVIWGEEC